MRRAVPTAASGGVERSPQPRTTSTHAFIEIAKYLPVNNLVASGWSGEPSVAVEKEWHRPPMAVITSPPSYPKPLKIKRLNKLHKDLFNL